MNRLRPGCKGSIYALLVAMSWCGLAAHAHALDSWRDVSVAEYRQHLQQLDALVAGCQGQRNQETCDPSKIGPDDRVHWSASGAAQQREVRYGWLRLLLDSAGKHEEAKPGVMIGARAGQAKPPSTDELLALALRRLADDEKETEVTTPAMPAYANERGELTNILSRPEYRTVNERTAKERFQEWLSNALNDLLGALVRFGSHSPWLGFVLRGLFLGVVCVTLIWVLIRIERRSRIKLAPDVVPVAGSPSAREWQLWLADARRMAAQAQWREAIHFVYWAAISRLESNRLWPADRARTPREYLQLLPGGDPRKANLTTLTRDFERTWYGGREAGSSDFEDALKLAAHLGVE
jgi:hypothetical protein